MTQNAQDLLLAVSKGYRALPEGIVVNSAGRPRKLTANQGGYPSFSVRRPGTRTCGHVQAHRLQAFQKFGDAIFAFGIDVRHKNGIRSDFSADNILFGTKSQNMMDKPESLRRSSAIKASRAVAKHNHAAIRKFYDQTKSYRKTMFEFGISSKGTLNYILRKTFSVKPVNRLYPVKKLQRAIER